MGIRQSLICILSFLLLSACSGSPSGWDPSQTSVRHISLCDLRNNAEAFSGKTVEAQGWIYADIERFVISADECAVTLTFFEAGASGSAFERFDALFEESKRGGWESVNEIFVVVGGRFLTSPTKIGKQEWRPGTSWAGGSSLTTLLVERVVCSVNAPMRINTESQARSNCKE